jgi:hypothetical protein
MPAERHVTGIFSDPDAAQRAIDGLLERSFRPDEIGVLVREGDDLDEAGVRHRTGVPTGAAAGGTLGAALGAVGATLVSLGTVPALGLGLAAAGPLGAAASGALAGAAGGGLFGTLAGLGYWSAEADLPEALRRGAVVVSVPATEARAEDARAALEAAEAERIED